ncbi:hypothetical protein TOPH_00422 [Tolypocladium ophioglossoides CBS 100239]|uniref:Uncharacterized protein n=1 Tax=Tolypocladium ophioglossoides (strain CBS 100239) TaxID=1163406 RepID=A0A0L0NLS2_TOLOC|nr:hypothetical protein TOPH_00422 [Tolypocladium ophioglossoides CBS 100239]
MTGLIPLALNSESPSKRYSVFLPDGDHLLRRLSSMQPKPAPLRRSAPRASLTPLYILPDSATEWKAALGDIKRAYMNKKYRQCSDRCNEILNSAKDLDKVQPAYLVYLRFYAATALEMQARAVHHSSPHRVSMFQQAQTHYHIASDLAKEADEAMSRPSSRNFSPMPSFHSPSDSDASQSSPSTRMSSPAPSLSSIEDNVKPAVKPKKRVAFRDVPIMEPLIRPDSPTLGFDDWLGRSSPEPLYPESILKHKHKDTRPTQADIPTATTPELIQDEEKPTDPFFHVRSVHRYCTILSGIKRQITSHLTILDIEIAACRAPLPAPPTNDELRTLEMSARVERLRANGWQRPRFNVRRYETLRENALADLL